MAGWLLFIAVAVDDDNGSADDDASGFCSAVVMVQGVSFQN